MARGEFHLLIDDMRSLEGMDMTSRTGEVGMSLMQQGVVTHLYMDNDLGEDVPREGIDIMKWARDNGHMPSNVTIVSANPVCRGRMEDILKLDLGYIKDGQWWRKPL